MFTILTGLLSWALTSFGNNFELKKRLRVWTIGTASNLCNSVQFPEIIALESRQGENATWVHGVPPKFADRKIARIFRVFNFPAIF